MTDGVIVKGIGGFYYVSTENGVAECRARGKFRKQGIKPMVGDRVKITVVNENTMEGAVEEIFERKNFLIRPPVANIECIVIVVAATKPQPDFFMIDKLILSAQSKGIEVVIAVNKTDLESSDEIKNIYEKAGYSVIPVCAKNNFGVDDLKAKISGKITAFAGNSGVGKSSLLNRFGLSLDVGDVSKIERGKHTTRHVELFEVVPGTYVMDTPGFSILEITDIEANDVKKYFNEIAEYDGKCRFADCCHFGTKPRDCAVAEAVANGEIPQSRFESYKQLYEALKEIKTWEK
ncbi:MAG: ribosome small subunit-dependent GTPase A [Clostridia bacterium]|nr:ribosome small subunit-dependent GTPase A [Clostridia bacterium]